MVLVDTSVWIRFLAATTAYAVELDRLLQRDRVLGHDFVYGELLVGDRGGRKKTLAAYTQMLQAAVVSHAEVVDLVRARKIGGLGIGWVDAHLLASALVAHSSLWTADVRLGRAARVLGLEHRYGQD